MSSSWLTVAARLTLAPLAAAPVGPGAGSGWELPLPPDAGLSSEGTAALEAQVEAGVDAELRWADFRDLRSELRRFYARRAWSLAWIRGGRATEEARRVAEILAAAARKGLDADDYGGAGWPRRLAAAERAGDGELARADVAFTVSALRYAADLMVGRIRPVAGTELLGRLQLSARRSPAADLAAAAAAVEAIAAGREPEESFASLEPPWPAYRETLALLARHLDRPEPVGPLLPLAGDPAAAERRIAQLTASLERWRWFPRDLPSEPLLVNVPEFRLRPVDGPGAPSMRVVVGQAYRWGTPLFASEITEVIFRPAWSVPPPIAADELVPLVEADREWIARSGFEVTDERDAVVPAPATPELVAGLRAGTLRLRQRPGPGNALGLVKFAFPSSWIYLHGTPSGELFARSRRDFSHGCIRVEEPEALAAWVLRGDPRWTPAVIRWAMQGARTLEVHLARPVPVFVGYFTAVPGGEGGQFLDDIYGQDAALATALQEERLRRGALR